MARDILRMISAGSVSGFSPLSFFQVNPKQTERLYGTALEFAGLYGRRDGLGSVLRNRHDFLVFSAEGGKVYGVEIIPQTLR